MKTDHQVMWKPNINLQPSRAVLFMSATKYIYMFHRSCTKGGLKNWNSVLLTRAGRLLAIVSLDWQTKQSRAQSEIHIMTRSKICAEVAICVCFSSVEKQKELFKALGNQMLDHKKWPSPCTRDSRIQLVGFLPAIVFGKATTMPTDDIRKDLNV